jgi:hypothetical protein
MRFKSWAADPRQRLDRDSHERTVPDFRIPFGDEGHTHGGDDPEKKKRCPAVLPRGFIYQREARHPVT